MTKQKTMEITYSGFAQGHTKKARSIFGIGFKGLKYYLSTYLEGLRRNEKPSDRTRQDLNQILPKYKSIYVELCQNAQ
jgi:hypothetical protein